MEFLKIDLTLPDEITSLYKQITAIEKNTILAGGYLSDLYMGMEPKDVDFFIEYHADTYEKINELFSLSYHHRKASKRDEHYFQGRLVDVITFEYNGYTVEFIFTNKGPKIVEQFDFRFREFYYDGNTYATKEALDDIKEKRFVFGTTDNPFGSFRRLIQFEQKYDFKIEKNSFLRLKQFFQYKGVTSEKMAKIFEMKTNTVTENILRKELVVDGIWMKFKDLPMRYDLLAYYKQKDLPRNIVEKIDQKRDFAETTIHHTFSSNFFHDWTQQAKEEIRKGFKKERLRLLYMLPPEQIKKIKYFMNTLHDGDIRAIRKILIQNLSSEDRYAMEDFLKIFSTYFNIIDSYIHFEPEVDIYFSNDVYLHPDIEADDYLYNRILKCRVNVPDHIPYSNLIINHETEEIVYHTHDLNQYAAIQYSEIVKEHLSLLSFDASLNEPKYEYFEPVIVQNGDEVFPEFLKKSFKEEMKKVTQRKKEDADDDLTPDFPW